MSFFGRLTHCAQSFCGLSKLSFHLPSTVLVFNLTPILKTRMTVNTPILETRIVATPMILSRGYCAPAYDVLEALHLKGPVIKNRFVLLLTVR